MPATPKRTSSQGVLSFPSDLSSEDDAPLVRPTKVAKTAARPTAGGLDARGARDALGSWSPPPALSTMMPVEEEDLIEAERTPFAELRAWRKQRGEALGVKQHYIAPNTVLREIVRRVPTTLDELSEVYGMGTTTDYDGNLTYGERVRKHGESLLAALEPHVQKLRRGHDEAREAGGALGRLTGSQAAVLGALAEVRDGLCLEVGKLDGLPSNRTLCEVVRRMPRSAAELRACRGLGAFAVERLGAPLLEVVARFSSPRAAEFADH